MVIFGCGNRTDDTGSLVQAAIAGIGVVHLASWLVSDAVATGQLVVLFGQIQSPAKFKSAVHAVRLPGRSHDVKAVCSSAPRLRSC
jgi:DNA-binding transcriptional LysR family regulator